MNATVHRSHGALTAIRARSIGALVAAAGIGAAVGVLTSFGQGYLSLTLNPLVNSASAWLVAPFAVGLSARRWWAAALMGLIVCTMQVVGYYVTASLRGYAAGDGMVVFWTVCGLVGGPTFALAGHLWRRGSARLSGLGAATLPSAFFAEGIYVYGVQLDSLDRMALWLAIGFALTVVLCRSMRDLRWFAVTVPFGIVGELPLRAALT